MPPFPPINKFKQWALATEKLTMTRCDMTGSANNYTYGRVLSTGTMYDSDAQANPPTSLISVETNADHETSTAASSGTANGFTCNTDWTVMGIWEPTNVSGTYTYRKGCVWNAIKGYHKSPSGYYLIKGTGWNDAWEPASGIYCVGDPPPASYYTSLTKWRKSIPVENEFVAQITTPTSFRCGNAILGVGDPAEPPASPTPSFTHDFEGYIELYNITPAMPDVFPYLRQGTTIHGCWAQIKPSSLNIRHYHTEFSGTTSLIGSDYVWSYSSNSYSEDASSGECKFATIGLRTTDNYLVVLAVDDLSDVSSGSFTWCNLTNSAKAVFANLNQAYKDFFIIPFSKEIATSLALAQAGDGALAKIMPQPTTCSASIRADGSVSAMDYECDAYKLTYTALEFGDVYVAFELPSSTVSTLLNYNGAPALA